MEYEAVIGLEVHVQLNTATKIFCKCSTEFGAPPNTNVCPVCMGQPGVLPVLNREVLHKAISAGLALNCEIANYSKFDRKNYFYPDLPKGYQISQYDLPISRNGYIEISTNDQSVKRIGITRVHMEEDAGKLVHTERAPYSLVDFNRAGVPLLEIVSEPDLRAPEEAFQYLKTLRSIMKYIEVSDVNMEEGSLRCDANISVRPLGQREFGTKVEIKNLNSISGVKKALEYEIERQIFALSNNQPIVMETRLFDASDGKTYPMRGKEQANDYRYFPEPDLPPIIVDKTTIEDIRKTIPELPHQKIKRFIEDYRITSQDAITLTEDKQLANYFEAAVKSYKGDAKKVANWIQSEVMAVLNQLTITIDQFAKNMVPPEGIAELISTIDDGTITGKMAKDVFSQMVDSHKSAREIIDQKGLRQVSDLSQLEKIVNKIINENPAEVEKYRSGKTNVIGFFVGQVMKQTQGKANPQIVNELLRKKLQN